VADKCQRQHLQQENKSVNKKYESESIMIHIHIRKGAFHNCQMNLKTSLNKATRHQSLHDL